VKAPGQRAYQEMLYGLAKYDKDVKEKWKTLLLQYCELDTAATVIVWLHWEAALAGRWSGRSGDSPTAQDRGCAAT
jgi:hypothetical protein